MTEFSLQHSTNLVGISQGTAFKHFDNLNKISSVTLYLLYCGRCEETLCVTQFFKSRNGPHFQSLREL